MSLTCYCSCFLSASQPCQQQRPTPTSDCLISCRWLVTHLAAAGAVAGRAAARTARKSAPRQMRAPACWPRPEPCDRRVNLTAQQLQAAHAAAERHRVHEPCSQGVESAPLRLRASLRQAHCSNGINQSGVHSLQGLGRFSERSRRGRLGCSVGCMLLVVASH